MAIDIKFDLVGNPEPPTIILANRNGNKLGKLDIEEKSIELTDKLNDASEFTFTMYKTKPNLFKYKIDSNKDVLISSDDYLLTDFDDVYLISKDVDDENLMDSNDTYDLWSQTTNFKLVYCKEWDMWFEITVELDEETETVKTVFCTQLGQAELSQIMLYDIEINTEKDIERDDYKITILYDPENSKASLLNRLLEKAPHYSIGYIAPTLTNIQRSFSFNETSIYDALQEVAEEIGCLFVFHSDSDEYGMPRRKISVYDLLQNCNDCGHRGEFTDTCSKCGSTNIKYGYGEDTTIFVTSDELASGGIQLTTDTDSVKNCFKLEAGDDLMTATIRNRNPNGTDYIWYFSDDMKANMPDEMVYKIESYDELYQYYYNEHVSQLDDSLVNSYNTLVDKYKGYYNSISTCLNCGHKAIFSGDCPNCGSSNVLSGKNLQSMDITITGFASLMEAYYNTIDFGWYLKSGLMPNVTMGKTDAEEQGLLLEMSLPPLIAVSNLNVISDTTADNYVLQMARAIVNSSYKVSIKSSELSGVNWQGSFVVENYSDEEDIYTTKTIGRELVDFDDVYIKQKVDKILSKENTDNLSITGLFEKDYEEFCEELKRYALVPLTSFHSACQACIDILIEQGAGEDKRYCKDCGINKNVDIVNIDSVYICSECESTNIDSRDVYDLYTNLYIPYYEKLKAIEAEMKIREYEVNIVLGTYDDNGQADIYGLQMNIEKLKVEIQKALNFQDYFGEDLWKQFCAYRREDKYSNSNYISDGLNNAELFKRALEFYEIAENEIFKSSELQHSISATLNNLLAIPKFKSLVNFFKVGNWIRVQIDDCIYKLRLLEYKIDYGDFDNISVEFSDVSKVKNCATDIEDILSQASSMASSYDSVQRQANQGNEARSAIRQWLAEGLDASLVRIQNNTNEDIVIDNNGLLGRSYSNITGEYSPEQIRLTHNIIAYTDDDWASVKMAIGKHDYKYYDEGEKDFIDAVGYGVSADFVTAGIVSGSQIIGGNIYSDNYSTTAEVCRKCGYDGEFTEDIREDTDESGNTVQRVVFVCPNCKGENTKTIGAGSYINLRNGTFSFGGGALKFNDGKLTISSKAADTNITEINEEWLKTTKVTAEFLGVNAANVTGTLTAAKIDAGRVNAGTLKGMEIIGGSLSIGYDSSYTSNETPEIWVQNEDPEDTERWNTNTRSKHIGDLWYNTDEDVYYEYTSDYEWIEYSDVSNAGGYTTYAEITNKGILNCKGANISGHINATSGTIGGCKIVNNTLTVGEANISSVSADAITAGTIDAEISIISPYIYGGSIYGGAFYDDMQVGCLDLSTYAFGEDTPCMVYTDTKNEVNLFAIVPMNDESEYAGMMICGAPVLTTYGNEISDDSNVNPDYKNTTFPLGNWDFSKANVSGLTTSGTTAVFA